MRKRSRRTPENETDESSPEVSSATRCPFARCNKSFRSNGELRAHVAILSVKHDELHPATDPLWPEVTAGPLFSEYHSRTRNLTADERKKRQAANAAKAYAAHKEERSERAKRNRQELRDIADVAVQLGDVMEPIVVAAENAYNAFGQFRGLGRWEDFLCGEGDSNTTPSVATFFRLTAFFLASTEWPTLVDAPAPTQPGDPPPVGPPIAPMLPGKVQFQKMSLAQHPDRNSRRTNAPSQRRSHDTAVQQVLNPSWRMWQDFLKTDSGQASTWTLPPDTPEDVREFKARSQAHHAIWEYHAFWIQVTQDTQDMMTLSTCAAADVWPALVTNEMVAPGKELIERAKEGKKRLMERDARRPKRNAASPEEEDPE